MSIELPHIYNIPAGVSFTDVLARGLLSQYSPQDLTKILILLPTRRGCRSLRDGFLRQSEGKPILLPRLMAFGDIDAEELYISSRADPELEIPSALPPLKRQILLAQLIGKLPDFAKSPAQDMALAQALGQLMDEIYTENLDLEDLPQIVDRELFAEHWQITIDFLSILSEHWPKILESQGQIDAADRRNRLILALNDHWKETPPSYPVIAAGSTGSIPATAQLLKTIASLPNGSIILPGLDQNLSDVAWIDIEEGHPQATLKKLLEELECDRTNIALWPLADISAKQAGGVREKILSHVMTPASQTDKWTKIHLTSDQKKEFETDLKNITRYDCDTAQEEAQIIAVLLREVLEDNNKTAALITPDRNIARRVTVLCRRWGINIDDSAGTPLLNSSLGQYLRLSAKALTDNIQPLSLLSFLKHSYNAGGGFKDYRSAVRQLEIDLLHGAAPKPGIDKLIEKYHLKINDEECHKKPNEVTLYFLLHLENIIKDSPLLFSKGSHSFKNLLETHIRIIEGFSSRNTIAGGDILWQGEEGEAMASLLSELFEYADYIPPLTGQAYLTILEQVMAGITVRPRYGTHPRLMILGQLEARLIQTDRVIISGLNEGVWPPDPGHDPWMSRPMRQNFGLPLPERAITLSAHDFVQAVCCREVFITRAKRIDDAPSVPARWLQRLDTFLSAVDIDPNIIRKTKHREYIIALDHTDSKITINRPAPIPPLESRPTKLSVTKIETWLKDPYSIYAGQILKLKKLDPIGKEFDSKERGMVLHKIMERFTKAYPQALPLNAADEFINIAVEVLKNDIHGSAMATFWLPRLKRLAEWVCEQETEWRTKACFAVSEAKGLLEITENINYPFTLTARADRIDYLHGEEAALIDYKSGGTYSLSKLKIAELNQLPLEAMILENGGFYEAGISNKTAGSLSYWVLTGGSEPGKITELSSQQSISQSILLAKEGLLQLIQTFEKEDTPYLAIPNLDNAPRFNDYEHLERVKEWAVLEEDSENYGEAA